MSWFNRKDKNISSEKNKKDIPKGLWVKCPSCAEIQYKPELEKNFSVCRKCEHHFRVNPSLYSDLLLDEGSVKNLFTNIQSSDPLAFEANKQYKDQLDLAKSGMLTNLAKLPLRSEGFLKLEIPDLRCNLEPRHQNSRH